MNGNVMRSSLCGILVALLGTSQAFAQTATGSDTSAGGLGGLSGSVTTPPTTTDTTGSTTTGTTGSLGGGNLTPFNESQGKISYNNMKSQVKTFQAAGSNPTASAATTPAEKIFNTAFLVPFIESVFEQLQLFIVRIAASSALGNALPPSTSAPA